MLLRAISFMQICYSVNQPGIYVKQFPYFSHNIKSKEMISINVLSGCFQERVPKNMRRKRKYLLEN